MENASNYSMGTITLNVTQRPANVAQKFQTILNVRSGLKVGGISNTVGGQTYIKWNRFNAR